MSIPMSSPPKQSLADTLQGGGVVLPPIGNYREGRTSAYVDMLEAITSYRCKSVKEVKEYLRKAIQIAEARGSTPYEL